MADLSKLGILAQQLMKQIEQNADVIGKQSGAIDVLPRGKYVEQGGVLSRNQAPQVRIPNSTRVDEDLAPILGQIKGRLDESVIGTHSPVLQRGTSTAKNLDANVSANQPLKSASEAGGIGPQERTMLANERQTGMAETFNEQVPENVSNRELLNRLFMQKLQGESNPEAMLREMNSATYNPQMSNIIRSNKAGADISAQMNPVDLSPEMMATSVERSELFNQIQKAIKENIPPSFWKEKAAKLYDPVPTKSATNTSQNLMMLENLGAIDERYPLVRKYLDDLAVTRDPANTSMDIGEGATRQLEESPIADALFGTDDLQSGGRNNFDINQRVKALQSMQGTNTEQGTQLSFPSDVFSQSNDIAPKDSNLMETLIEAYQLRNMNKQGNIAGGKNADQVMNNLINSLKTGETKTDRGQEIINILLDRGNK